ncbi:hypothetical protein J7E70_07845 [Variovorax paradoxus]|nr:hypothetical protein [Variovorax paradoxus]MBT2300375.1 hypothetical protein [Variovorax paradoxus]
MAASVANARKANTSGATSTTTSSFTSTAGSTIWVGVSDASGQGSLTISDNKGNTYTQIGTTRTSASGAQIRRYYCANIAGGSGHTVTATWGSNSDATVHVMELAGVATASLDSAASAQADDNNPPWTVTSGTLAQADSIAVAMTGTAFSGTWSESSGFTVQTQEGDNGLYWTGCAASRVVAATTAITPSFTISGGGSDCAVAIDVFKASAGGGDVSAALTGVAGTGAAGTVAPSTAKALTGGAGTGSPGSVAVAASKALTGNAGTGAVGTTSPSVTIALAGNAATGVVGTVSAGSDATAALTGVAGTGAVGSVSPAVDKALSGNAGAGGVGTVVPSTAKALSGNAGTGSPGSVAPSTSAGLSGNPAAGSVGTAGASVTLALSGVAGTGAVGAVVADTGSVIAALTGTEGTGQAGSLGIDVVIALTGVSASGIAGDVSLPSTGGGRDDEKKKVNKRVAELNKKILEAEALEEAQESPQEVKKAVTPKQAVQTPDEWDEDEEEALMLLS